MSHHLSTRHAAIVALAALAALGVGLSTLPARADLVVSSARNAPGLTQGMRLPDGHRFVLPENSEVRVMRSPGGQQFTLRGKFEGTLGAFIADCSSSWGGSRPHCSRSGDSLPVGGTRGINPAN